jgi:hypothetical protein
MKLSECTPGTIVEHPMNGIGQIHLGLIDGIKGIQVQVQWVKDPGMLWPIYPADIQKYES